MVGYCEGQKRPGQETDGERIVSQSDTTAQAGNAARGLSLLGSAMTEEVAVAARGFRGLLRRVVARGRVDVTAMQVAETKIDEAEMWARKAIEQV